MPQSRGSRSGSATMSRRSRSRLARTTVSRLSWPRVKAVERHTACRRQRVRCGHPVMPRLGAATLARIWIREQGRRHDASNRRD